MGIYIPKSVFVDTNVLLDDILIREGTESAKKILELGVKRQIRLCLSALSVVNIAYITRKAVSREKLYEIFGLYINFFVILTNYGMDVYHCIHSDNPDFEDAMQLRCATLEQVDAIFSIQKRIQGVTGINRGNEMVSRNDAFIRFNRHGFIVFRHDFRG